MPPDRKDAWLDAFERGPIDTREGLRGLEPDFGGPGTTPRYRGGSFVDQEETTRTPAGPYAGVGPKGYVRSDSAIYEDVCDRLMRSADLDASDVEVSVRGGEVTLAGWVDDREQKRLAEDLADAAPGVQDVHNRVRLRYAAASDAPGVGREGGGCND